MGLDQLVDPLRRILIFSYWYYQKQQQVTFIEPFPYVWNPAKFFSFTISFNL